MSYNSKRTIVSMAAGNILIAAYILYVRANTPANLKAWAITMLAFLGIAIAASIAIQILFHIVLAAELAVKNRDDKEAERILASATAEDEREKLIGLKASRIGYTAAGIGFMVALAALAFGLSAVTALHILLGSFALGNIAEGFAGIILHERGVHNGG